MKKMLLLLLVSASFPILASGWTNTAKVDDIEIIRGQGFQIRGDFGNPSQCSAENTLFVSKNHVQYDQLLSLALTAFTSGKKLKIFSHSCISYGWHGGTHNQLTDSGSMYIKN